MSLRIEIVFFSYFLFVPPAYSDWSFGGHAKVQPSISLYRPQSIEREKGMTSHGEDFDIRVNSEWRSERSAVTLHSEVFGRSGTTLQREELVRSVLPLVPEGAEKRNFFDLTHPVIDDAQFELTSRFDRAVFGWFGDDCAVKIGRDALSFGNGIAFQVLDLFNPFSPIDIDRDYKSGADMIYMQYVLSSGAELEFAVLPRKNSPSNNFDSEESSFLFSGHTVGNSTGLEFSALAAQHYGEWLSGVGVSADVLGAVMRSDLQVTYDEISHEAVYSVIGNIDRSWEIAGYNFYTFIEYYRNGFGTSSHDALPSASLTERIARGELFMRGRDIIVTGGRIELSALTDLVLSEIVQVNDGSAMSQLHVDFEPSQNSTIQAGVDLPIGPVGTEFGGREILPQTNFRPPWVGYVRLGYYW